ncbi:MAG TPA: BamA/TamA family outer membrane protein, partial [bacterium]
MKNRAIVFISLIIIFYRFPCFAQQDTSRIVISTVNVQGNRQFSAREIQKIIPPGKYSTQQLKSLVIQLLEKYRQKGFYFAEIEPKDTTNQLLLKINEGPELFVSKLNIIAKDSSRENEIRLLLDSRKRGTVEEAIKFNAEQILDYLDENGYPYGEISIDSLIIAANRDDSKALLKCHLGLRVGTPVTIDSIIVQGNTVTKSHVITREMRLQRGEIYNQQRINRSQNRLQRTGLLNQVDEPQIFLDPQGHGVLLVNVKEGNPNQLNAVLGYNPATNNREKGYITGLIDVAFRNLLGTGRVVEAFWQKKDQRSQELRLHYIEPWVRGYPINVGTAFQQTIQDTTFIRRNLSLEINSPLSDVLTIQTNFGKEDVLPDSFGQILYQLPRSNSWLARLGFQYDTRDNLWNPARGVLYQTQYEYARKRVSAAPYVSDEAIEIGNFRRDRWLADIELYIPVFRWQTILVGLHGRQVKSNESAISISDLFRFGGTNSVRGYREEEFSGEKIAWLNLEYRYLLAPRSRVFLFMDGGYFYQKNQDKNVIEDYKIGYGFGLRIETRLGIMGIDYG